MTAVFPETATEEPKYTAGEPPDAGKVVVGVVGQPKAPFSRR
jgi:hypothetical protein